MLIIISKGRSTLRGATADMLCSAGQTPILVVPEDEVEAYLDGQNQACRVLGHPRNLRGLPAAMAWTVAQTSLAPTGPMIIFDDDLHFFNRFDGTSRLPKNEPHQTLYMVEWLRAAAMTHGHATISPTQFNNHHPDDIGFIAPARSVLAFDARLIRRLGIAFDRVPSKNDYDVTLQMFAKGYGNICAYNLCHKQVAGPTLPGGCTEYRNEEMHREASEALARLHPGVVKVVVKHKPEWPFPRHDVVISWKRAYEQGIQSILR